MTAPLVSVVLLTFNGKDYVEACLSSVFEQSHPNVEVVVVDNASGDGTADLVAQRFPSAGLIRNSSNMGFAAGNNVGIRVARGDYIAILNQDTKVDPHWLEELVKVAEEDQGIGICASKLLSLDAPERLNDTGQLLSRDLVSARRGLDELDRGQYDRREEVFGATGAAAFCRRQMLNEIGLFDEDYFILREDDELNLKARFAGWRCMYVPTAVVYHAHSVSTGRYSPLKLYYGERNRVWNVMKFLPPDQIVLSLLFTFLRYLTMASFALRSKEGKAQTVRQQSLAKLGWHLMRAWLDAFRGMPDVMRKRRQIQRMKKVSNREVRRWLTQYSVGLRELARR